MQGTKDGHSGREPEAEQHEARSRTARGRPGSEQAGSTAVPRLAAVLGASLSPAVCTVSSSPRNLGCYSLSL